MDSFAILSLKSFCTNISHISISASIDLASLIQNLSPSPSAERLSARLLSFSGSLEQYGHTADQLERRLERHGSVMSPALQGSMATWLGTCQGSMGQLHKQLSRLELSNAMGLDWDYLVLQRDLLVAYTQLFLYYEELLALEETDTQDSILDGTDARRIIEQVEDTLRYTSKVPHDILPGGSRDAVAGAAIMAPGGSLDTEEPPPSYEAVVHSVDPSASENQTIDEKSPYSTTTAAVDNSPASPTVNPLDFTSLDLSSLRHGLRAITSRLGWFRPEPLASALCEASRRGDVQQIAGLLQQGANIDGRNEYGHSPLSCAISADQVTVARMLLSAGADAQSIPSSGGSKWPALFVAAQAGSLGVAALLIEKGARPKEKSMSGQPYFFDLVASCAADKELSIEGIRFLLENGASAQASSLSGRKAIVAAAKKGRLDIMKLLLDHGASARTDDYQGNSLLSIALEQNNSIPMAELLLQYGSSPNSTSTTGDAVLSAAVSKRNVPFARLLLAAGARAKASDLTGQPIIVSAVRDVRLREADKTELVRLLLKHGASALAKDSAWAAPVLHHAVEKASAEVVSLLMQHGADASGYRKGEPLLFSAIQFEKPGMVEALLKNGASANVLDSKGNTPMMGALIRQDLELVRLLRRYLDDIDVAPQEFARALGRADFLEALGMTPVQAAQGKAAGVK